MQIGEVIRKYRKEQGMTQEEMANRLGVSAPAVNKWENGNALPDIMLLAPIARLLDVTLDELLSFREELTEEEIKNFNIQLSDRLKKEPYEEVFEWAKEKVEMYPNCELLIYQTAVLLDVCRLYKEIPDSEKYDECINRWYVCVLNSKNEMIKNAAADSLFGFYLRREQYEKAEEYLSYLSEQNPERKRKQAVIYSKTDRIAEAYKAYEELLFSAYGLCSTVLYGIYMLAIEEQDMEKAHALVETQKSLAITFDMGEYNAVSCGLDLATREKDAETTMEIMKKLLDSADDIYSFTRSPLYEHMKFKEINEDSLKKAKSYLVKGFQDKETYDYLDTDQILQSINL